MTLCPDVDGLITPWWSLTILHYIQLLHTAILLLALGQFHQFSDGDPSGKEHLPSVLMPLFGPATKEASDRKLQISELQSQHGQMSQPHGTFSTPHPGSVFRCITEACLPHQSLYDTQRCYIDKGRLRKVLNARVPMNVAHGLVEKYLC